MVCALAAANCMSLLARQVWVGDLADLQHHMVHAVPGTELVLRPGTYRLESTLRATAIGMPNRPLVLQATVPGTVWLDVNTEVGIKVSAPHWVFRNLGMRGVCEDHNRCEHAFHVVGAASHSTIQGTELRDFNAHIKVNGLNDTWPDNGRIEANTLLNTAVRRTSKSVTPVDIVGGNGWVVSHNHIAGFAKQGGNGVAYGAFMKGGGRKGRFEHNTVVCNPTPHTRPGQQVGLSFGGGGTDPLYCRDKHCAVEHSHGWLTGNRISNCNDVGIYLNRAPNTTMERNTLERTKGTQVRER